MQHVFSLLNFLAPTQEQAFCVSLEAPETIFMISDCSVDTFLSHRHSARPTPPKSVLRALVDNTDASAIGTYHPNIRFVSGKCRVRQKDTQCHQSLPSLTAWGTASTLNVPAPSLLVSDGFQPQKEKDKDTPSEKSVPVGTLRARGSRRNRNVPPSTQFATFG